MLSDGDVVASEGYKADTAKVPDRIGDLCWRCWGARSKKTLTAPQGGRGQMGQCNLKVSIMYFLSGMKGIGKT
jgi:hypothetical protein